MKSILKKSFIITAVLMLLCGLIYPLTMTGISQLAFNKKANGSIVKLDDKEVGSEFLGQNFTDPRFLRGRISAYNYNTYSNKDLVPDKDGKTVYSGVGSGSQNLAPSNKFLKERVQNDIEEFLKTHPGIKKEDIPGDLLTSSGSGLDPHISPKAAEIQIAAISKASGISKEEITNIIKKYTEDRSLMIFGEPRVNIMKVNLEIAAKLKDQGKL